MAAKSEETVQKMIGHSCFMPAYGRDGWYEDVDILGDFAQDLSERLAELGFDFYTSMGDASCNMLRVYPSASARSRS